jgi:hypothetical protein
VSDIVSSEYAHARCKSLARGAQQAGSDPLSTDITTNTKAAAEAKRRGKDVLVSRWFAYARGFGPHA